MSKSLVSKFAPNQAGTIAVMTGVLMPVVIGGFGLGGEVSYWYFTQRKLQNAADVAAYAGAVQLRPGQDQNAIESAALAAALKTGYRSSIGAITTNSPAVTGAFAGVANTVEATVREDVPRLFTSLFLTGDVPISGRAVARVAQQQPACILALNKNKSRAAQFTGSSNVILEGCSVHSNSVATDAFYQDGSSYVEMPCASTSGTAQHSSGLKLGKCRSPIEHAAHIEDPYKDLPEPPTYLSTAACEPTNTFGGGSGSSYTISKGRYCGGLNISREVKMEPGLYIIDGGTVSISSTAVVKGTGVTLYLTNDADLKINGGADVQLSAPTAPASIDYGYKGILLFVDRDNKPQEYVLNGNSSTNFQGAIYASSGEIKYAGSNTTGGGGCTQIVASTVEVYGDAGLGMDCTKYPNIGIKTNQLVQVVE